MDEKMFCFQCEQAANGCACVGNAGVCGKSAETADAQDALTGALIGFAELLVELGQAEAFGAVDEYDRRIGDVDADFDDARRDQELDIPFLKGLHDGFFLFAGHTAVDEAARALFEDAGP